MCACASNVHLQKYDPALEWRVKWRTHPLPSVCRVRSDMCVGAFASCAEDVSAYTTSWKLHFVMAALFFPPPALSLFHAPFSFYVFFFTFTYACATTSCAYLIEHTQNTTRDTRQRERQTRTVLCASTRWWQKHTHKHTQTDINAHTDNTINKKPAKHRKQDWLKIEVCQSRKVAKKWKN